MVEPEHLVTQVLMDRGHQVLRLHYRECLHGPGREVPSKIRTGEITGLCVIYQRRKLKSVPEDKITKFNKEMNVWIKHAKELGIPLYIIGVTGSHWQNTTWEHMVANQQLYESKHRFCALGLKLSTSDVPSNVCIKILSDRKLASTPCTCGIPFAQHLGDWNKSARTPEHSTHSSVFGQFCCILADKGVLAFGSSAGTIPVQRSAPDVPAAFVQGTETVEDHEHGENEHMYPTEERVEWKKRRKENKEKGIEVKKRTKVVEDHHDDCGTDISGLGPKDIAYLMNQERDHDEEEMWLAGLNTGWLKGSEWTPDPGDSFNDSAREMCDVYHMFSELEKIGPGIDIVELCSLNTL